MRWCYCTNEEHYFRSGLYPCQKWIYVFFAIICPYELQFSWCELPFLVVLSPLLIVTNLIAFIIGCLSMFVMSINDFFDESVNYIIIKKVLKDTPTKYYILVLFITTILTTCLSITLPVLLSPSKYCYLVNVTDIHDTAPLKWQATVYGNDTCINMTKLNIVDYKSLESYNDQMLFVDLNCQSGDAYVLQSNAKTNEDSTYILIFISALSVCCPCYFVCLIFFVMDLLCKRKWYLEDLEEQQKKINNLEPRGTYKLSLVAVV